MKALLMLLKYFNVMAHRSTLSIVPNFLFIHTKEKHFRSRNALAIEKCLVVLHGIEFSETFMQYVFCRYIYIYMQIFVYNIYKYL